MKKVFKNEINKTKRIYYHLIKQWDKFITLPIVSKIFKFFPKNIFLFVVFLISLITIYKFYEIKEIEILYSQDIRNSVYDPIINDSVTINMPDEMKKKPGKICIYFATYGKKTNSEYKFALYKKEKLIKDYKFNSNILSDNQSYCFDIANLNKEKIKEYSVKIIPIDTNIENAITIWKNADTNEASFFISNTNTNFSIKHIIIIIIILTFLFINYIINTKRVKVEHYWLIISFLYLLPILFIYPAYQIPDEPAHFYNAYRLSQFESGKSLSENANKEEIITPKNINCLNYSKVQNGDRVDNFNEVIDCLKQEENHKDSSYKNNILNSKIGYAFSSLGIKIADILTNSPLFIFYVGRIFNFIMYSLIVFVSIKTIPKYKNIILSIATMPMFIQQSVSYNYDSMMYCSCLLMVSIIVKMINNKINWKRDTLILLLLGSIISNIKYIYLPIMLLLLFIPNKNFKKRIYKYVYCFILLTISFGIGIFFQNIFIKDGTAELIFSTYNMNNILKNPKLIFNIAINTIDLKGMFYLRGLIGYFGWFQFKLNDIFILIYFIYFIYLIKTNKFNYESKIDKLINIAGYLVTIAGIFAAMYFGWSADGLDYVEGVQGRYFIPLIFSTMLMFMNNNKKNKNKTNEKCVFYFINIILLQFILTLIIQYY